MSIEDARELVESLVIAPECQIIKTIDLKGTLIMALDELEQYRAIGTVSEFRELKEMSIKEYAEAVVVELENINDGYVHHCINNAWQRGFIDGAKVAIRKAIEIVRNGGKE